MAAGSAGTGRRTPLRGMTVLYDPHCRLCSHIGGWLRGQRQLVPITLVPVGSAQARTWFPALDHDGATQREITVVGDAGQVYTGDAAWVVCLWALADHRAFSHTLATPAGRRLARAAALGAAKYRGGKHCEGKRCEATGRERPGVRPGQQPYPAARTTSGTPARGAPLAGRGAAPAPVWVYDGSSRWTQQAPRRPPHERTTGNSEQAPAPRRPK